MGTRIIDLAMLLSYVRGDGTVDRIGLEARFPSVPANPNFTDGVASKDVQIDPSTGVWVRIFLPESVSALQKVPVVVFFPGGGFVMMSPSTSPFHNLASNTSARLGFIFISVAYRKAPEHRLPAAFQDCFSALKWLQSQAVQASSRILLKGSICSTSFLQEKPDEWLSSCDFSSCFLMGHSAGGIIVHQVALMASETDISPLRIRGLISCASSFGGERSTLSELTYADHGPYTLKTADAFRALAVPLGADATHHYVNFKGPGCPDLRKVQLPPVLLVAGDCDFMHDRQIQYYRALQDAGKVVTLYVYKGYDHLILFPEIRAEDLDEAYLRMKQFIQDCLDRS